MSELFLGCCLSPNSDVHPLIPTSICTPPMCTLNDVHCEGKFTILILTCGCISNVKSVYFLPPSPALPLWPLPLVDGGGYVGSPTFPPQPQQKAMEETTADRVFSEQRHLFKKRKTGTSYFKIFVLGIPRGLCWPLAL